MCGLFLKPLSCKATVYTQVIESLSVLELPHPNPPLGKGRELDFPVSPLSKGGLRGVKPGSQSNSDLCVHRSSYKGRGWGLGLKENCHTAYSPFYSLKP